MGCTLRKATNRNSSPFGTQLPPLVEDGVVLGCLLYYDNRFPVSSLRLRTNGEDNPQFLSLQKLPPGAFIFIIIIFFIKIFGSNYKTHCSSY